MAINSKPVVNYPDATPNTFERGLEFQDFVGDCLQNAGVGVRFYTSRKYQFERGESAQGIEVKLDYVSARTGRLFIETAEKAYAAKAQWTPSGICREDNTRTYIIGHYEQFFVFVKRRLLEIYADGPTMVEPRQTSRGFYLPFPAAAKLAYATWTPETGLVVCKLRQTEVN